MTQPEATGPNTPAKRRLGRGINAMFGAASEAGAPESPSDASGNLRQIDLESIERNPFQPRTEFDEVALHELSESIKQHGVLQPLLVRPLETGYQLIAGERRLLASKRAGLKQVPCQIRTADDQQVTEAAIEENLKRQDLNPLEKAHSFKAYLENFECSIEDFAKKLSMTRSSVSNTLRLLELPDVVQQALRQDYISSGHARALLTLETNEQCIVCSRIVKEGISVRKTEDIVRGILKGQETIEEPTLPFKKPAEKPTPSNHVLSVQDQLQNALGVKVEIKLTTAEADRIVINFANNDDFERIVKHLRPAA